MLKPTKWTSRHKEGNGLTAKIKLFHSYPHVLRTKKPVIFRATPQWFAVIDAFRQDILDVIENDVKWHHPSGQVRIVNMFVTVATGHLPVNVYGVPPLSLYGENGETNHPETTEHVAKQL